jgi:hypothetical protein
MVQGAKGAPHPAALRQASRATPRYIFGRLPGGELAGGGGVIDARLPEV